MQKWALVIRAFAAAGILTSMVAGAVVVTVEVAFWLAAGHPPDAPLVLINVLLIAILATTVICSCFAWRLAGRPEAEWR